MTLDNYLQSANELTNPEDAINLIKEVIENPQIFVFGELLDVPIIQSLKETETTSKWFNLLNLFAYGKLMDYNEQTMPALTDLMIKKLRLLTIVTLGTNKSKKIPYSVLSEELKLANLRDLEDLIIEAIYSNLIKGKLDQKAICLEIEWTLARDVRTEKFDDILGVLNNWISNCENILKNIDRQANIANSIKSGNNAKKVDLENYINNVRKTLKTTQDERMDDVWEIGSLQQQQNEFEKFEKGKRSYNKTKYSLKSKNHKF